MSINRDELWGTFVSMPLQFGNLIMGIRIVGWASYLPRTLGGQDAHPTIQRFALR